MTNIIRVEKLKGYFSEKPSKYPTTEEKTTLIAKPALVISLKSKKTDFRVMLFASKGEFLIEGKDNKKLRVMSNEF